MTHEMVLERLDKQLLRMQIEEEERLIISKRESGEEDEYKLTRDEIMELEGECLRKCCVNYNAERLRYQFAGNEKRRKRMEMACAYLYSLVDFTVNANQPLKRKKRVQIDPFPQFDDEHKRKTS